MTRTIDLLTAVALLAIKWAEVEIILGCITTGFLLAVTIGRYLYKLWLKIRDRKITKQEAQELKQDTAELIQATTEAVGKINNIIKESKKNGTDEKED